jgi:hypothetical protein
VLVTKLKIGWLHLHDATNPEPQQNPLLHPGIHFPASRRTNIWLRRANTASVQCRLEFVEGARVFVADFVRLAGVELFNGGLKVYQCT